MNTGLARLRTLLSEIDAAGTSPTPRELAELVWLAELPLQVEDVADVQGEQGLAPDGAASRPERAPASADSASTGLDSQSTAMFLPSPTVPANDDGTVIRAVKVRVNAPDLLVDRRELARALRRLKRYRPSPLRRVLDEEATATHNAQSLRHWNPVFAPAEERWLTASLIVDTQSGCVMLWEPLAREFRTILHQIGAFRDVQLRYLHRLDDGTVAVSPSSAIRPHLLRSPRMAVDAAGRTATFVLTDLVASTWRGDALHDVLKQWASHGPTVILQALPEYTWEKTAATPTPVRFHSPGATADTSQLSYNEYGLFPRVPQRGDVAVPVLELSAEWLGPWARSIAEAGSFDAAAIVLSDSASSSNEHEGLVDEAPPPQPISVDDFRASVQPRVFRLATYLAAAPLNLSVMRMVQSVMLPDSPVSELAEIIFSGLLRRVSDGDSRDALTQAYDFAPTVRERLLSAMRSSEADDVIAAVSEYVERTVYRTASRFTAAALDPEGPLKLPAGTQHWADVHNLVRRRQGRSTIQSARPRGSGNAQQGELRDSNTVQRPRPPQPFSTSPSNRARLADPNRSRIVLIGAPTYRHSDHGLPDIPQVANNLADLAAVFADPELAGFDAEHCVVASPNARIDEIGDLLVDASENAEDMLLVYYAGHGLLDRRRGDLYMTLADTHPERLAFTALAYETLRSVSLDSRARSRVVILDCCFSGRVLAQPMAEADQGITSQLEVAGTYVLTSSPANRTAVILPGERHTAFTARLLDLLQNGDPQAGPVLSLGDIYRHLVSRLRAEGLPLPQQRGTSSADLLGLVRNRQAIPPAFPDLPDDLRDALHSRYANVRLAAVTELASWLSDPDQRRASAAATALQDVADNDNPSVAAAARSALAEH